MSMKGREGRMKRTVAAAALALVCGCLSFNESQYPAIETSSLPEGKEMSVQIQGFAASVTDYLTVYGYDTVWMDGYPRGRYGYVPGRYRVISTSTYVPQVKTTDAFAERARTIAETAGFVTKAQSPDYAVSVEFGGPFITDGDRWAEVMWMLLTVFTADYNVQTWTAKLKIYDNRTGKLVLHRDYSQKYEVNVWGPLPLLSPAGSEKNTFNAAQSWCLAALTDRTMADATAFLVSKAK